MALFINTDKIDEIIDQINNLDPSNFDDDWKLICVELVRNSLNYELSFKDFLDSWISILMLVFERRRGSDLLDLVLMDLMKVAIVTMPLSFNESSGRWIALVEMLHEMILKNEFPYITAKEVLLLAEKKFGCSYNRALKFWSATRSFERKLAEINKMPKEQIDSKMIEIYKKQFSKPYKGMEEDWNKFRDWIKNSKLNSDVKVQIQEIFIPSSMEAEKIQEDFENMSTTERSHYLKFGSWIETLLQKTPPCLYLIEVLCEEMIFEEPESYYFHVYVCALASNAFSEDCNRGDKLFDIIKRGLKSSSSSCNSTKTRFVENAILVASNLMDFTNFLKLVDLVTSAIPLSQNQSDWFYSRRAILIAVKNSIISDGLDGSKMKETFQKLLNPVSLEFYEKNILPIELVNIPEVELRLLELLKIWILGEKAIQQHSFIGVFEILKEYLEKNDNPHALLNYSDFIRFYGSYDEAVSAYRICIGKLERINNSDFSSHTSREYHLQLLANYLELQMLYGNAMDQTKLSQELSRMQSVFTLTYSETYAIKGGLSSVSTETLHVDSYQFPEKTETSVTEANELKAPSLMSWNKPDALTEMEGFESGDSLNLGFPLFISNLSFNAKENDIKKAFLHEGVNILRVDLKKNPKTFKSRGFGTLYLRTKEEVKEAIQKLDRITILGRAAFLSFHRDNKPKSHGQFNPKPQTERPTMLHLSDIPVEWKDPMKITQALSCYSHIRSVTVNDKEEPCTAKVEFYMAEDADLVCQMLTDSDEFEHFKITVRKCFPPKLKGTSSKVESHKGSQVTGMYGKRTRFEANREFNDAKTTVLEDDSSPAKKRFTMQRGGRQSHMKRRLDIPIMTSKRPLLIPNNRNMQNREELMESSPSNCSTDKSEQSETITTNLNTSSISPEDQIKP